MKAEGLFSTLAGKSTLALSLLRILEASEGRIVYVYPSSSEVECAQMSIRLDGIDISSIGLEDLRSRVVRLLCLICGCFTDLLEDHCQPRCGPLHWNS